MSTPMALPPSVRRGPRGVASTVAALWFTGLLSTQAGATSQTLDPADPAWSACLEAVEDVDLSMSMPPHLLAAIALTETGHTPAGRRTRAPWPWTINVRGQGMRFASKAEAVRAVQRLLDRGIKSIDTGCMQVNLKYHPRAFTSLEEAFDPLANATYAAHFLSSLKARSGTWDQAIRSYHSHDPARSDYYSKKVATARAALKRQPASRDTSGSAGSGRALAMTGDALPGHQSLLPHATGDGRVVMVSLMPIAAAAPIVVPARFLTGQKAPAMPALTLSPRLKLRGGLDGTADGTAPAQLATSALPAH